MAIGIPSDTTLVNLNRPYVFNDWYPGGFIDHFIRKVPFQRLQQPTTSVAWNTATSLSVVAPYAPNAGGLGATPMNATHTSLTLRRIGDSAMVDALSQASSGNTNELLQAQIVAKKIGIIRKLGQQIIQGDGTGAQLIGLQSLVDTNQEFNVNAVTQVPTTIELDKLINLVRASDGCVGGGADCLVAHETVIRFIINTMAQYSLLDTAYDPDLGVPVVRYRGIPIYIGQITSGTSPPAFDIWALKLKGPTGIRVVHATGSSDSFGIDVQPIPMQAETGLVGAFVGGLYGVMVPEVESIARLQGTTFTGLSSAGIPSI